MAFNPLNVPNVAFTLALELTQQPLEELPPAKVGFPTGAGVYALYYLGKFPAYKRLATVNHANNCSQPIYIGKAVREGARQGLDFSPIRAQAVLKRLQNHCKSIELSENLNLNDFRCRYLVVEDAFIALAESTLISVFRPLWNQVIDGFGNNPTGAPRQGQAVSNWDVVHPGRNRGLGKAKVGVQALLQAIEVHLAAMGKRHDQPELQRIAERIETYTTK